MTEGGLSTDARLISYMTLRKAVGFIGILLPFVLAFVNMVLVSATVLQGSVSGYYYTGVRDVLVGSLCAIGVFLFTYSGHDDLDKWITNAAGVFAIGVAFFPTAPENPSASARATGYVHVTFAALLFVTLAVIALWLFRKTEQGVERKQEKKRRDLVYLVCGSIIVLCVALVPIESSLSARRSQGTSRCSGWRRPRYSRLVLPGWSRARQFSRTSHSHPTSTPTAATPAPTASSTLSPSPTRSQPSPTASQPSPTPSATSSPSPSPSRSPTPTPTPSYTPSPTPSATP